LVGCALAAVVYVLRYSEVPLKGPNPPDRAPVELLPLIPAPLVLAGEIAKCTVPARRIDGISGVGAEPWVLELPDAAGYVACRLTSSVFD